MYTLPVNYQLQGTKKEVINSLFWTAKQTNIDAKHINDLCASFNREPDRTNDMYYFNTLIHTLANHCPEGYQLLVNVNSIADRTCVRLLSKAGVSNNG